MKDETYYLLTESELMKIQDLCESLGLAIDKIIRGRQLIREPASCHPAVQGYEQMIDGELNCDYDRTLDDLF
jgi:hypothetical protein